jgi:hypothetical protein
VWDIWWRNQKIHYANYRTPDRKIGFVIFRPFPSSRAFDCPDGGRYCQKERAVMRAAQHVCDNAGAVDGLIEPSLDLLANR